MLLVDEEKVKNLQEELCRNEEKNAFIPIIAEEQPEEGQEQKLNLIISNRTEYFDRLFELLNLGYSEITKQSWNLLTQIPVNQKLYNNIKQLNITSPKDWGKLIDFTCIYKQLYSLQIINSLICADNENLEDKEIEERI